MTDWQARFDRMEPISTRSLVVNIVWVWAFLAIWLCVFMPLFPPIGMAPGVAVGMIGCTVVATSFHLYRASPGPVRLVLLVALAAALTAFAATMLVMAPLVAYPAGQSVNVLWPMILTFVPASVGWECWRLARRGERPAIASPVSSAPR